MVVYTIYHIPGQKVGCTDNIERRMKAYPEGTQFEIIEEVIGTPQEAGDIEWKWADFYDYRRGLHYTRCLACSQRAAAQPAEKLFERGRKRAENLGAARLSEIANKAKATLGHDFFVKQGKDIADRLGYDGCSARSLKAQITMGPEVLKAKAAKGNETLGAVGRSERTRKRNDTVRRNKMLARGEMQ